MFAYLAIFSYLYSLIIKTMKEYIDDGEERMHALGKQELACMYFPKATPANAVRMLNRYLYRAHGLMEELERVGFRIKDRQFTSRQVQLIVEYLGEP